MALHNRLCVYCWCLVFTMQCFYNHADARDVSSGNSGRENMTQENIAHHHWKRGDFQRSSAENRQQLGDGNDTDVMKWESENDVLEDGTKTSNDRYRDKAFGHETDAVHQDINSEGRAPFKTMPNVKHSKHNLNPTEMDHLKSTPTFDVDHLIGDIVREKCYFRFDKGEKTYGDTGEVLNEQSESGYVKPWMLNYSACGPNKECLCYDQKDCFYANCSGRGFKDFPTSLSSKARIIDLSYNSISCLFLSNISRYPMLEQLSLAHNIITHTTGLSRIENVLRVKFLDLRYNKLTHIPHLGFLSNLKTLLLSYNHITDINRTSFLGLRKLDVLHISHNDVRQVNKAAFDSLGNLKELFLNSNAHLGYSERIFPARLFWKLTKLEILWIQNNTNRNKDKMYPNKALGKLTNLRELAVDGLGKGVALGPELENLLKLNSLLIGYHGNCYIESIQPDFFGYVKNVKSLVFSGCTFTSNISPDAFRNLRGLEEYAVIFPSDNYNLSKASQDLEGLIHTNITALHMDGFRKFNDRCRMLTGNDTKHCRSLKLKKIYMDYDFFSQVTRKGLIYIPRTLEQIHLRCNRFSSIDQRWSLIQYLTALREIDVRDQNVNCSRIADNYHLPESISRANSYSDKSDRNIYEPVCSNYADICKENYSFELPLKSKCDPEDLGQFCLPPNLQVVKASGYNEFGEALFSRNISQNILCYLDFSRGFFTTWGKGTIPERVKIADLGDNFCDTLSSETFHVNNSLRYLCIQNNYLGPVFASDVNGTIFSRLKHLVFLNIARNGIYNLNPKFFQGLKNLRHLNLMDNKVENVKVNFSVMPHLNYIDLSKNAIKWITRKSRHQLDALAKDHAVALDLSLNPLPCTCQGIKILQWLGDSNVKIKGWDFLTCENEKQDTLLISEEYNNLQALKRRCAPDTNLMIASSFSCTLVTIVIVVALLYKHRWKLIYARNTWLVSLYGPGGNVSSQHTYDAYVVYCEDDRDFALYNMIEELEGKRGHKLCLEDRDFIPGSLNFSNITCAIINSTVTLLLLSPGFVVSKELEYAIQMALMEQYNSQTKRDLILVFCYQEVPDKDMSKDLLMLRKMGRCLDYPVNEDDSVKKRFWDRLSDEIGHTRSNRVDT